MQSNDIASATATESAKEKESRLIEWLVGQGSIAIGYSGGVDSAYLAAVAVATLGPEHVVAVTGRSASYPDAQWTAARAVAREIGVPVVEIDTDELNDPRYASNPSNRCYYCKAELWSGVVPRARERGMAVVADGTNADDLRGHRPGVAAARERGVLSPLALFGFSKEDIRNRSRVRGLSTWRSPSSPCLSSRIPYGTPVTVERLRRVERAEAGLRALGVAGDLRVRHFGDTARVEMSVEEMSRWRDDRRRSEIERTLIAEGYTRVEIDPRGFRSGALLELPLLHRATLSGD